MSLTVFRAAIFASAMLAATSAAFAQEDKPSVAEACPNLTAEQVHAIENYKGQFSENAWYARTYCVSVEEAERRMAIQLRDAIGPKTEPGPRPAPDPNAIGTVAARLREEEAATFAGLWIEHSPEYRVVVAFTRDGAKTLAKYTSDPLFVPLDRPGPAHAELRATQERLIEALQRIGVRWASMGTDEKQGVVEVQLGQDAASIRAAAARGDIELPDHVRLVEPRPFPIAAPPPPAPGDKRIRSFPQLGFRTDMYPRTLVGVQNVPVRLVLDGGCLKLEFAQGKRITALWQAHDALDLSDPAKVSVLDRFSGSRIAADEDIVLMGLQPGEDRVPDDLVGTEGCPGPYHVVRGYMPRAAWQTEERERAIEERQRELGSRAAAERDLVADLARVPGLQAWREELLAKRGDVVAGAYVDAERGTAHLFHTPAVEPAALIPAALRPHVTAQVAPVGYHVLESARASLERQLAAARVEAQLSTDSLQGVVHLRPADPRALSGAGTAGSIEFPAITHIEFDPAQPLVDHERMRGRNPDDIWLPLEAAPDFAEIRKLVETTELPVHEPPMGPPGTPEVERPVRYARPSRAGSLQMSQFLVGYGQTAREIAALKHRGFDPVDALDAINGRATWLTKALLARQVVVAELVSLDPRDPGRDGFRSSATWRVVETLKGDAKPGQELRTRLVSGEEAEGTVAQSNEEPLILPGLPGSLEPGGQWLLFLNDAQYERMALIYGGEGAARQDHRWYVPMTIARPQPVRGGEAQAPFLDQKPIALAELRAQLAPLQAALIDAGLVEK